MFDNAAANSAGGDEAPMTPEQARRLKTLAAELADPEAFDEILTTAEAARRIIALEARLERERHSGVERLPRT